MQVVKVKAVAGAMVFDPIAAKAGARRYVGREEGEPLAGEAGWPILADGVDVKLDPFIKKCLKNGSLIVVEEKLKKGTK